MLTGDDFYLRPWKVEDAAWYVDARDDEVFKWTTEKRELTIAETEQAIRQVNASSDDRCFAVVDTYTQELIGNIALSLEADDPKSAEISYWLASQGRGRGIATKAVELLCEWAFHSIGLERITLKTLRGNVRSQRVAQRAGFRLYEGGHKTNSNYVWFERCADT